MVILSSYHQGYEWTDRELAGILDELNQVYPLLEPSIEHLDAKRFPGPRQLARMKRYLEDKYRGKKLDLIMVLDNPALDFVLQNRTGLFPGVPLVFAGINDFHPAMLQGQEKVTGVAEVQDFAGTLDLALSLHPGVKEVLVIHDYTTSGLVLALEMAKVARVFKERIKFIFTPPATFREILAQLQALPPGSLGLITGLATDSRGKSLGLAESTRLLAEAPVSLYALHETRLGHGIVGGVLLEGGEHGRRAGALALKVLKGEDPSRIPVITESTARPMFDYQQLARFKIPLKRLPEGSVIINRPVTFYEQYQHWILTVAGITTFLSLVIFILGTNIIRRHRAEKALLASETALRSLIDCTGEAMLTVDAQRIITTFNRAFTRLTGYSAAEAVGQSVALIHPSPEKFLKFGEMVYPVIAAKGFWQGEFVIRKKDGTLVPTLMSLNPQRLADGTLIGFIGAHRDITEQKRTEEEIRRERRILRDILEATLAGYWDWDIPNQTEYLSPTFKKMFGYEDEELPNVPESWQKLIFPEDLPGVLENFARHVQSRGETPFYNEVRYRHKDGSTVWVICAGRVIEWNPDGAARRMVGCHVDISKRKRAEEALRESEEKYRLLFDHAPLGIMHFDGDGTVTDLNDKFAEIIGAPKERIIGFNMPLQLRDERMLKAVETSLDGGIGYYEGEYLSVTAGKTTPVRAFYRSIFSEPGEFLGGVSIFEDFTEKFLGQQRQQEYLNFLQTLMDAIPNPVFYKDTRGTYLGCNKACEESWGCTREDLIGKSVFDLHPQDLAAIYYARDAELLAHPGVQVYETTKAHADGSRSDILLHKATFSNLDGTLGGIIGVEVDITARKQAEGQILASLKEKEVLLQEIHHRVKNNMQIISALMAMQIKHDKDKTPAEMFQDCRNRIRSMALIHESLYCTDNLAEINFRRYLEQLVSRLQASYAANSQGIRARVAGTDVKLDIRQAVPCGLIANELIVNSLKHAFSGRKGEIQVTIEESGNRRVLEVRDNGAGLSADLDVERTPTFGWTMMRNLAKQLGGELTVASNGGTCCRVVF